VWERGRSSKRRFGGTKRSLKKTKGGREIYLESDRLLHIMVSLDATGEHSDLCKKRKNASSSTASTWSPYAKKYVLPTSKPEGGALNNMPVEMRKGGGGVGGGLGGVLVWGGVEGVGGGGGFGGGGGGWGGWGVCGGLGGWWGVQRRKVSFSSNQQTVRRGALRARCQKKKKTSV